MDSKAKHELNDLIRQLNAISNELDSISGGIGNEFKGIGAPLCARSIKALSNRYRYVKRQLDKIE